MQICKPYEGSDQDRSSSSFDYIIVPFPNHELEPFGWHDILATLDTCAQVHGSKQCNEEGYDIKSMYTLQVINEDDSRKNILPYDEEIIVRGPNKYPSKVY